jgi:acyl carrier protein|tara:strand:+ start:2233 stop:2457 length:225 start_codon:yes stop_codon:yes gene_type:complete
MENKIKEIIKKTISRKINFKKDIDLIQSGFLDSFSVLVLIANLEKEFKIKISLKNFDIKSISTIKQIVKLIKKN